MHTIRLSNSTVAVHDFGDPRGDPLLFFHGWPGSGRQASLLHVAAQEQGYHVYAPDRPGIGASTRLAGRRIVDWPAQVEQLAEALNIDAFPILAVSGGGPYALACAAALPRRVRIASVVCGAPPIADLSSHGALHPIYRMLLWLFHTKPMFVRNSFAMARPFLRWESAKAFLWPLRLVLSGPDRDMLGIPKNFDAIFQCTRDAFHDVDGLFEDAALYAAPLGFALKKITVPVQFWHGMEDDNFHWTLARDLAKRVPSSTLKIVENEGHYSLPIRHAGRILAAIRTALG